MKSYTHFTLEERESLRIKLTEGKSMRQIARELGRNVSSVSREYARNKKKTEATTRIGVGRNIVIAAKNVFARTAWKKTNSCAAW